MAYFLPFISCTRVASAHCPADTASSASPASRRHTVPSWCGNSGDRAAMQLAQGERAIRSAGSRSRQTSRKQRLDHPEWRCRLCAAESLRCIHRSIEAWAVSGGPRRYQREETGSLAIRLTWLRTTGSFCFQPIGGSPQSANAPMPPKPSANFWETSVKIVDEVDGVGETLILIGHEPLSPATDVCVGSPADFRGHRMNIVERKRLRFS